MTQTALPFELDAFLARERERVEGALERALADLLPGLPGAVARSVRHGVLAGGKRLRPVLCVAAYRACGGPDPDAPAVYDLAASLELVHAYSLMHDDLPCMDDAPLRRGSPTPHTVHGEASTTLGGAVLIPAAALHAWKAAGALGLPEAGRRDLVRTLCRAAGGEGMVGGQALDLEGEGVALARAALDDLHARKTGALLAASLRMGAIAAGAGAAAVQAMEAYGRAVGLAFQITDDVLDATASAETLGKAPSDDALRKSTYVGLLGVEGARREARAAVAGALTALDAAGRSSPPLAALARFVVERAH